MDLRKELLKEHSLVNTLRLAKYIGNDKTRFVELMKLFFANENLVTQRAVWVFTYSVIQYPELVKPYLSKLIKNLENKGLHVSVKRNTLKVLQNIAIPTHLLGRLTNICFAYLIDVKEAIAVKAYSMSILVNITKREPGLKNEIRLVINEMLTHGSPGIKSRSKKVLKEIDKITYKGMAIGKVS